MARTQGLGAGPGFGSPPSVSPWRWVMRAIQATFGIYNVKHYGAKGDGSTDDTAAMQAAIDACNTAGGGVVWFPKGTYLISTALSLPNFVCLEGVGQSSILRASGNNYAINLNPANRVRIHNLQIDASSAQSAGGGIDWTNAANNVWGSDIWFGNNLYHSLNIAPTSQGGIYILKRLRWNGVTGCTRAIVIGDGSAIVSDVYISHAVGTAATTSTSDMTLWVRIAKGGADTVHIDNSLFYQGSKGMEIGSIGASGDATNHKFTSLVFDSQDLQGVDIQSCRGVNFVNCAIQGCGTSALPGLKVGTAATAVTWTGGFIHENESDGISIANGSAQTTITGAQIHNNNRTNQTFGAGITVSAGASDWTVANCSIGNGLVGQTANQKYGVLVGGGASDNVTVTGNRFPGNVTAAYGNSSVTGQNIVWKDNVPDVVNSKASAAALTLPPGEFVTISGTTNVTSITASRVGRMVVLRFSGILTFTHGNNIFLAGAANFVTAANSVLTLYHDGTNYYEIARKA